MTVNDLSEVTVQDDEGSDSTVKLLESEILAELAKYLSSSIFHQVGPVIAKRIVATFGIRTVEVIERSPRKLAEVKGVGTQRIMSIAKGWTAQRRLRKACMMLYTLKHRT